MLNDSSARPHGIKSDRNLNNSTQNLSSNSASKNADTLKRRAQSLIDNKSIDGSTRAVIRYALEINDPLLAELVRRADAGEPVIDDELFVDDAIRS